MVRRALVLLAVLLASACTTVGPNYRLPDKATFNTPNAQGPFLSGAGVTKAEPLRDHWWQLYDDPVLDNLISAALAANTDLRVADANLRRSRALLDANGAGRDLQASVSGETSYAQRSAEAELQHVQPPTREIYNVGVAVSYDLDLFGGLKRGIEAASADTEAAVAARDLVRINVAAETARAYADVCNSGQQLEILRQALALQHRGIALTQVLIRNGRAMPFESDRRESLLAANTARLPRLQARQRNAVFRIAALQGRTPGDADMALLACHRPLELIQPIPTGDGQALLRRRPDIRSAERRLAASTARIGVATAALYPDIKLGASAGSTGAAVDFASPLTNRFGIGPLISWTVNRHAARAQIEAAKTQSEADLASFDGTVVKALREVETALNSYAAGLEQQQSLESSRAESALVVKRTRQLRRGGKISELPALEAERDLIAAEQAAAEGRAATNEDQITLFLALGGGWTIAPPK